VMGSGGWAAWLGLFMGGDPVVLCWTNCYGGDEREVWLWWRVRKVWEGFEKVRVVSGLLVVVLGGK
jgi:hypothetical protein